MARRRRAKAKTRTVYAKAPKRKSRKSGSKVELFQPDAMVYGAVRGKISSMLSGIIGSLPIADIGDEVIVGLADWFIAKHTGGFIKKVAMKGLTIENAFIGASIGSGAFFGKSEGSGSNGQAMYG